MRTAPGGVGIGLTPPPQAREQGALCRDGAADRAQPRDKLCRRRALALDEAPRLFEEGAQLGCRTSKARARRGGGVGDDNRGREVRRPSLSMSSSTTAGPRSSISTRTRDCRGFETMRGTKYGRHRRRAVPRSVARHERLDVPRGAAARRARRVDARQLALGHKVKDHAERPNVARATVPRRASKLYT